MLAISLFFLPPDSADKEALSFIHPEDSKYSSYISLVSVFEKDQLKHKLMSRGIIVIAEHRLKD